MMNLELLFWAAKNGGSKRLYDIAVTHANTTMKNHFRNDYSAYHVMLYDTATGLKIKGITHQGYADSSMWARGQAWAIYGFTLCYRETQDEIYLDFAQHVADIFLKRLPKDNIPYWDFDAPGVPGIPKDASAAAVASSAVAADCSPPAAAAPPASPSARRLSSSRRRSSCRTCRPPAPDL